MHYNTKRHNQTRGRTILMVVLAVITIANAVFLLNRAEEARNRWVFKEFTKKIHI